MQLKKITFTDFRCFRGNISIDLEPADNKNIIVILGDNTHGKSTIVQAFVWCFYGKSNFENPEIYNRDLALYMPVGAVTTPSVEVVFEHESKLYTARRSQSFRKRDDGKIVSLNSTSDFKITYIDPKTGQTLPCGVMPNDYNRAINNILPGDLAQYFFFEGEKNQNLTTKSLGDAVKNLMGIQALSNMKTHLYGDGIKPATNSVIGYYQSKLASSENVAAQEEWNKMAKAEQELNKISHRLEEIKNALDDYAIKINSIEEKLRDAAPTQKLQEERDKVKRDYEEEKIQLNRAFTKYISLFNDKVVDLFTLPLLSRATEKLSSMDLSDKGIKDLTIRTIRDLLQRGVCLCGTDLKEGSLAYKNVEKYINYVAPKNLGQLVSDIQDQIEASNLSGQEYINSECEAYSDVQFCLKRLRELELREDELLYQLSSSSDTNIKQYKDDLEQYKKRVTALRTEKDGLLISQGAQQSAYDTASNNYSMYTSKMKKNVEFELYLGYANALYNWLIDTYKEKEQDVRIKLQNAVTTLFNSIYSGNRKVIIDESYNIKITPVADTGGLKAIQYFSYVGGLVQVAKQVMKERQEGELYGEEYPLVLDAAFSHTDKNHTKAIALELAKVTNQLVFAVMDKDWENVSKQISDKIAKTYVLRKLSEDEVTIEEA